MNLAKKVKDRYSEIIRHWWKELNKYVESYFVFIIKKNNIIKMLIQPKAIHRCDAIPIKISMYIL